MTISSSTSDYYHIDSTAPGQFQGGPQRSPKHSLHRLPPHQQAGSAADSSRLVVREPKTIAHPLPSIHPLSLPQPLHPALHDPTAPPRRASAPTDGAHPRLTPLITTAANNDSLRSAQFAQAASTTVSPTSSIHSSPLTTPRQSLNYPLPLTPSQTLAAIAVMQERQESWTRAAQSSSSASAASSPGSSTSPINRLNTIPATGAMQRKSSLSLGHGGAASADLADANGKRSGAGRNGKPRKKVAKACLTCQKSHLTCDEQRPCTRCMKKGIGDQCVEGVRKKAKYLLEGDERDRSTAPPEHNPGASSTHSQPLPPPHPHVSPHVASQTPLQALQNQTLPLSSQPTSQNPSIMQALPNLLPDQPTQPRVPDDVWLSAPMGGLDGDTMGMDARQIWGDTTGTTGNASAPDPMGGDSSRTGSLFSLGPTAAADEFHMFDSMFGNMSPVFPFETTPGSNDNDPFGLQSLNNNPNGNDTFGSQWANDFGSGSTRNTNNNNMAGLSSYATGNGSDATGGNGGFDLNPAWTSWTGANSTVGNGGMDNAASNAAGNGSLSVSISPVNNAMGMSIDPPSRSNSAPGGLGTTLNDRAELSLPNSSAQPRTQSTLGLQTAPSRTLQTQSQTTGQTAAGEVSTGGESQEIQPIGTGPFALTHPGLGPVGNGFRSNRATPSEVYRAVVKPYDYTEGYHVLMQYLTTNFEQRDILRVVHSLAAYRPSLIALQMPMSEEDEVFIERSFQRTLIELEKLISYSATPTAVWRRTGEVCYANPEFCRLVGQNEADLCGKKSYIYHIFAKPSCVSARCGVPALPSDPRVIAYWENFSNHAFENTTQNFFQPTVLQTGGGGDGQASDTVQCSACYTIRRDVFDLPSVIIGQFLPIPTDVA